MQPISKSVASTIAAVQARARLGHSSSPARSSDIATTRGTPSPVPPVNAPSSSKIPSDLGGPDGGEAAAAAAINYVSESSSSLSETYRPANECRKSTGAAAGAAAAAASASSSKQTCFKQVQFHLNNIALSAPLLKHKLGGGAHSICPNATAAAAAATATTQARLLSQIPILRSVRKTRKKRKKLKPSEAAKLSAAEAAAAQHQQQVLANLPPSKAFLYSCLSKSSAKMPTDGRDIVYNGTFPIDQPLCSRFKNLSFSLSSTDTELDGARGVPRAGGGGGGFESAAEQMLRKRSTATGAAAGVGAGAGGQKVVKTFAIDEPI